MEKIGDNETPINFSSSKTLDEFLDTQMPKIVKAPSTNGRNLSIDPKSMLEISDVATR
jgi:hypothetical protein